MNVEPGLTLITGGFLQIAPKPVPAAACCSPSLTAFVALYAWLQMLVHGAQAPTVAHSGF